MSNKQDVSHELIYTTLLDMKGKLEANLAIQNTHSTRLESLETKQSKLSTELTKHKTFFGLVTAAVATVFAAATNYFMNHYKTN